MIQCNNCGYPVINGMHICPNCLAEMPDKILAPLSIEEDEVYLSRQNTVPHDKSIDDEEQACLFFSDGHWFIEDRSRDNSTYVHAGAGIKLEPGDIIRMGDRLFKFNIKTKK